METKLPIMAPKTPSIRPSMRNSLTITTGGVPMAAIVPISFIRSYTLIIITFIYEKILITIRDFNNNLGLMNMIPVNISKDALEFIKKRLEKANADSIVIYFAGFG
jgi:hypothetical protein